MLPSSGKGFPSRKRWHASKRKPIFAALQVKATSLRGRGRRRASPASLPPPRALSGLPPPLPPTIGAICWMSFPGLDLRGEFLRHARDQRDGAVVRATENGDALEAVGLQRVGDGLECVAVGFAEIRDDRGRAVDRFNLGEQVLRASGGFALLGGFEGLLEFLLLGQQTFDSLFEVGEGGAGSFRRARGGAACRQWPDRRR